MRALIASLLLLFPVSALAFPASYCTNDADPVPDFAEDDRDANGCMLIDPDGAGGASPIPFNFESNVSADPYTPALRCDDSPGTSASRDCAMILWDREVDDFLQQPVESSTTHPHSTGGDISYISGRSYKYLYFRNGGMGNGWECDSVNGWNGPSGSHADVDCEGGAGSGHMDSLQLRCLPIDGGWAVFQDWAFVNSVDQMLLYEIGGCSPRDGGQGLGGHPNFVFQGVHAGYENDFGIADNWTADCQQFRASDPNCGNPLSGRFQTGSNNSASYHQDVWLINTWSTVAIEPQRTHKIIVVNGGIGGPCNNVSGCNGSITPYTNGWVAPLGFYFDGLNTGAAAGPSTCPNGLMPSSQVQFVGTHDPQIYCYTSIEAALADTLRPGSALGDCPDCPHVRPPFIHLSDKGWATAPSGGGGPPVITATVGPNPIIRDSAHTLGATIIGGDCTPCTVTWDCDGDGACDDGSADTSSPYEQLCTAFSSIGNKTLKACVTDDAAASDTGTVALQVDPLCGDGITEGVEVCDVGPPEDLGNPATDECDEHGFATDPDLACAAGCLNYDFTGCDTVGGECDDGNIDPGETIESCFQDAATVGIASIAGSTPDGKIYYALDIAPDSTTVVRMEELTNAGWNFVVEDAPPEVQSVLFVVNADRDDPRTQFQTLRIFALAGDHGIDITDIGDASAIDWPKAIYQIDVIPCSANWATSTADSGCTGAGGVVGPTFTFNLRLIYRQSVMRDLVRDGGIGNALLRHAREALRGVN